MSCPTSGGDGRGTQSRSARMRPRFYPHGSSAADGSAPEKDDRVLLEADSSDASEQEFAASLDAPSASPKRFVPGPPGKRPQPPVAPTEKSEHPAQALSLDEVSSAVGSEQEVAESLSVDAVGVQFAAEESQPASEAVVGAA